MKSAVRNVILCADDKFLSYNYCYASQTRSTGNLIFQLNSQVNC